MNKNMGKADRAIRIIIAVVIAALIATNVIGGTIGTIAGVIAVVFLLTSLVGFCPAYRLFGVDTCSTR